MDETDSLKAANANLKIALDALAIQLAEARAEISQLKKEAVEATKPRPKVTPQSIALTDENVERLMKGLRAYLHPNAMRKKYATTSMHLITMHNNGKATAKEMRHISGLSFQGFSVQSRSLRKIGLMIRQRYTTYILGEKGKEVLNKVFGE
jgi:hypothetical protein